MPATSSVVHDDLGCSGAAFDLNAACAGYVYSIVTAVAMLGVGYRRALVIGADTLSRITDQDDRSTAVLFADGAGAVVIEASDHELLLAHDLGLDGSLGSLLYCDHGGYLTMEGKEVFRRAVRASVESAQKVLAEAGVGPDDIALFVPHQANLRIIDAAVQRLGLAAGALRHRARPDGQHLVGLDGHRPCRGGGRRAGSPTATSSCCRASGPA